MPKWRFYQSELNRLPIDQDYQEETTFHHQTSERMLAIIRFERKSQSSANMNQSNDTMISLGKSPDRV
jgi:hypothetical protein